MGKETIKVYFKGFYESFNFHDNVFVWALSKRYKVIIDENPDYLFYSVYRPSVNIRGARRIGDFFRSLSPDVYVFLRGYYARLLSFFRPRSKFSVPLDSAKGPVRIFYGCENNIPDMSSFDWAISTVPKSIVNHKRYIRLPLHRLVDYPFDKVGDLPFKRVMDFDRIKREKKHFCNFIYSQDHVLRNRFFRLINSYKPVDAPGVCMNNMPAIGSSSPRNSRLSEDWVSQKLKFLKNYKFTIAFENADAPGWVTEKLTHPLLVNSIPIYVGTKTVSEEFNTKAFLNVNDFSSWDEFLEYIRRVDTDDKLYRWHLEQPIFTSKKQQFLASSDNIVKSICSIVESERRFVK